VPEQAHFVIVLGPYRSGTSLTARMLTELGVSFGPARGMVPADLRNPTGYLERDDINGLNRALIKSAGRSLEDPGDPATFSANSDLRILQKLESNWMHTSILVGIKDPRMCVTLDAWFESGILPVERTRVVHITRDIAAATASALKHDHVAAYADGDPDRVGKMLRRYAEAANWQLAHREIPHLSIRYEAMLESPLTHAKRMADFLESTNRKAISRSAAVVGRNKARFRYRAKQWMAGLRFRLGGIKAKLWKVFGFA